MSAIFVDCQPRVAELLTPELRRIVPDLVLNMGAPTEDALPALIADHAAALIFNAPLPERVLAVCPGLRLVVYLSTGVSSYIDLDAAERLGLSVRNVAGYGDRAPVRPWSSNSRLAWTRAGKDLSTPPLTGNCATLTSAPWAGTPKEKVLTVHGSDFLSLSSPEEVGRMNFRPLHDRVVVRRIEERELTSGGIIVPDTAKEKPMQGKIVAVGPGARDDKGKLTPLDVKAGDVVLFGKWSGTEVKIDGDELLIMKESDIMGVVAPSKASTSTKASKPAKASKKVSKKAA